MIGSGTIESACKQIVTHRLKLPGAQWTVTGVAQTAKVRAVWLSNQWQSLATYAEPFPWPPDNLCLHTMRSALHQMLVILLLPGLSHANDCGGA
jgi:hypothetical protein